MNKEKKYPHFLETAQIVSMKERIMELPFLEAEEVIATRPDEEGYSQLNIVPKKKVITAESYQTYARLSVDQIRDLDLFNGINAKEQIKSVLQNEMLQMTVKSLYEKYFNVGLIQREVDLSKWKKWLTRVFRIQHVTHVKKEKLGTLLMKLSHRIASSSRLGKGDFVVMPSKIVAILSEDPKMEFSSASGVIVSPESPKLIGTYYGLQIYDNVFSENDTIVCGRHPKMGEPGVYFFDHSSEFLETEESGPAGEDIRISLRSSHAIVGIGRAEVMYYTEKVSFKKKPLWKKLLRI